jgi:hypothetical protein
MAVNPAYIIAERQALASESEEADLGQAFSNTSEDGCLLLSLEGGLVFSINGSGLRIWELLELSRNGVAVEEVVDCLARYYADCAPPKERLLGDVQAILSQLEKRGLIKREGRHLTAARFRINDDVFRTDGAAANDQDEVGMYDESITYLPLEPPQTNRWRSISDTARGLCGFLIFDLIVKLRGFGSICQIVESSSVARNKTANAVRIRQICAGVDRARLWYPKPVLCLQHSAVIAWLLRKQGVEACLRIAGRQVPFYAHAWVEVGATVVNDEQSVRQRFSSFRRCLSRSAEMP